MAVQGVFASDANIVGNRIGDFAGSLLQIMPDGQAPLLALSAGMESMDAYDTIINWFEENHISGRTTVASFVTNGDGTGFVIDDASSYVAGTVLLNETSGEVVLVTAVTVSSNTITVTRGVAGTTTTVLVGDKFQRIGTAFEENSSRPVAVANLGYVRTNYVQIFRNAWNVSGTAQAVRYHTGSQVAKSMADCAVFHSEDIERAFLWGKKAIGTLNSQPMRLSDGIYAQLSTNVTAAGGTTTYAAVDTWLQGIFSKNIKGKPNERISFLGNKALSVLNAIAKANSTMFIEPGVTEFGMNIHRWITPYGTVMLKTHPLFTESPFRTKDWLVLHPGAVRTRYLRRTHTDNYNKDGSRAGVDGDFGVMTTEVAFEYRAEVTGGVLTGLTAAA